MMDFLSDIIVFLTALIGLTPMLSQNKKNVTVYRFCLVKSK